MASVTGGQAAVETTDVLLSYGVETAWGTKPSGNFKALRITGESLTSQKQRSRPSEITRVRQVAKSVTQQKNASGGFNFALSFGTFDDVFAALLGNTWTAPLVIDGVGGDIVAVASGNKLTSATANKFSAVQVGQWIRLLGFFANGGANNGLYRVTAKTNTELTLAGKTLANETPAGTNAKIRGSMLRNDNEMQSLFIQKQLGSAGFLHYPGALVNSGSLSGGIGNFFSGSFGFLAKDEVYSATTAATVTDAPTGGFHDAVASFGGCWLDDTPLNAGLQNATCELTREGAAMDYAMGSAAAQGARWGQLGSNGRLELFFKDFDLWRNRYDTELQGRLAWATFDDSGNAYVVEQLGAVLTNPTIQAGGPNQPVVAAYTVEGNPSQDAVNRTIAIHKLPLAST